MIEKVQEELDRVLVFFDEQMGHPIKPEGAVILVTEYGLAFEMKFDDFMSDDDGPLGGIGTAILVNTIGVGPIIIKSLVDIVGRLEESTDFDHRISGFVLILPAENSDNEKILLIEAHDRLGDKLSYSCPVGDIGSENETVRMRSIDPNDPDKAYLKHGVWPWQLN